MGRTSIAGLCAGAPLIVVGSCKHSRTREVLLGGTTRCVVRHAGCVVLMAN